MLFNVLILLVAPNQALVGALLLDLPYVWSVKSTVLVGCFGF